MSAKPFMSQFFCATEATPPAAAFAVGDRVEIIRSDGTACGIETIKRVKRRHVQTSCGRLWTPTGEWFDGARPWPFPSIRKITEKTQ